MVAVISSPHNAKVKYVRSLHRRRVRQREKRMLLEGTRLIAEALAAGVTPELVLFSEDKGESSRLAHLVRQLEQVGAPCYAVTPAVFAMLTDTVTPQGIVAVVSQPMPTLGHLSDFILILDQVRDPGNLGTILRTAAAAGVEQVLITPGSVDPYSPKVVRAGMGAHFRLAICANTTWEQVASHLTDRPVWLAEAEGGLPYDEIDWTLPTALILGGEARGASTQARRLATGSVTIPIQPGVESLNVAAAAAVLCFERARQQRSRKQLRKRRECTG
ncbi:MAG TPA: RNA methyltransferase [Anaerolineae bacterium]|nr:RNA methyltransferase [Anaerolineae bacterium]HIQ06814.1 RNA methyltransferase [Anaerolineae bacterium]